MASLIERFNRVAMTKAVRLEKTEMEKNLPY